MLEPTNLEIACSPGISYSVWQTEPIFSTESRTILTISVISLSLIPTQLTSSSSSSHQSSTTSDSIQFKLYSPRNGGVLFRFFLLVRSLSSTIFFNSLKKKKIKNKKENLLSTQRGLDSSRTGAKILTKTLTFPPRIHPL